MYSDGDTLVCFSWGPHCPITIIAETFNFVMSMPWSFLLYVWVWLLLQGSNPDISHICHPWRICQKVTSIQLLDYTEVFGLTGSIGVIREDTRQALHRQTPAGLPFKSHPTKHLLFEQFLNTTKRNHNESYFYPCLQRHELNLILVNVLNVFQCLGRDRGTCVVIYFKNSTHIIQFYDASSPSTLK